MIEWRVERAKAEGTATEEVPVKRFDMAEIENEAVPLGDWPVVKGLFANEREDFVGAGAGTHQSGLQIVADADSGRSSHGLFLSLDAPSAGRIRGKSKDAGRLDYVTMVTLCWRSVNREMNAKAEKSVNVTIAFHGVEYCVPGTLRSPILTEISMEIGKGETLVLLGRSGSGKTTLLKLVNRLLKASAGEIFVNGNSVGSQDPIHLRRGIGYVIQEGGLFPHYTVAENVGLVPELEGWEPGRIAARVEEMMRLVGLEPGEFGRRRPRELSGGQRQRVGVARALAADPPILLMDEPFGALDPVTRAELQHEFAELSKRLGKTIVFVTHDLREAMKLGTRIVLLAAGRIVADARPEEFLHVAHPEVKAFAASFEMGNEARA